MTLEDFFTLTEMKNGLTTCARVEELICVMRKLSCVSNNVGDAARQRSTAASALACTQNMECLALFVHLDGLGFLNHWLQEAVKCSRDVSDGEELINTLIGSLDKLPMNSEKLSSSGILKTIESLFGHTNVNIKERARMLFDKWNNRKANNGNGCRQEMGKDESYPVDSFKLSVDTLSIESKHGVEEVVDSSSCQTADEGSRNKVDDDLRLGDVDDVKCSTQSQALPVLSSIENDRHMTPAALVSDAGQENLSVQEGNFIPRAEMESPEILQVKDDDPCNTSGLSAASHSKNSKVFRSASCNPTLNEGKPISSDAKEALHRCASVDRVWPDYSKTMKEVKSGEEDDTDILCSNKGSSFTKESAENSGDIDHCNEPASNACEGDDDTFIRVDPSKTITEMDRSSDSEPESGEMDALEIARLVAIEVEREVVDYREELCSSPEVSSNEVSIEEGDRVRPILGEANGNKSVPVKIDFDVASSPKDDDHMLAEMAADLSHQEQSLKSLNGAAAMAETGKFDFDLNEDASIEEDIDYVVNPIHPNNLLNLSAPIAVSASKGAPVFMITPPCFDGELGWKGSAATSAFRPASPRRAFDGEKSESVSKYRSNLLELDLNVTDCENLPVSSGMPSWNSSSEVVSSMRVERMILDLNSYGEDEAAPSRPPLATHRLLNGARISSPASSSSSLRQLPPKNFDLNDSLFKTDDPASSSITASRMPAERRAHANQTHQSYMGNGLSYDSTLPYPHQIPHPSYGYIAPGAGMAIPFQPAVYGFGSIAPHMVDSRGATVVPQLLSSAGANGAPLATLPYLMSITNAPSSSNGGGGGLASQAGPVLDLNFGMMQRETGKPPLMPGQSGLMEEQISSGNSLKRKEPESGWDSYSFGYKDLASWH